MKKSLALISALVLPAPVLADGACEELVDIFDEAIEEWPDLLSTAMVKPRVAAMRIAAAADANVNYAIDDGWTEDELAPIIGLRDTPALGPAHPDNAKELVPSIFHSYLTDIVAVMAVKCPETVLPDISDLSLDYPED
jgi:hypothetical protein